MKQVGLSSRVRALRSCESPTQSSLIIRSNILAVRVEMSSLRAQNSRMAPATASFQSRVHSSKSKPIPCSKITSRHRAKDWPSTALGAQKSKSKTLASRTCRQIKKEALSTWTRRATHYSQVTPSATSRLSLVARSRPMTLTLAFKVRNSRP